MTSGVNTPPSSMNSWSDSRALSTSSNDPGTCFTLTASSGGRSYRSLSMGSGGSILFFTPSSPARSIAANARYGLHDGSGERNSRRLAVAFL